MGPLLIPPPSRECPPVGPTRLRNSARRRQVMYPLKLRVKYQQGTFHKGIHGNLALRDAINSHANLLRTPVRSFQEGSAGQFLMMRRERC